MELSISSLSRLYVKCLQAAITTPKKLVFITITIKHCALIAVRKHGNECPQCPSAVILCILYDH